MSVSSCSGQAKRYSRVRPRAWASRTSAVRRGAMTPLSSSREVPCRSAVLTVIGSDGRAVLGLLLQLFGLVVGGERFHDHVQFSVHDEVELMQGEADAVVGHAILRKVVGADLLAAVARADHAAPLRAQRRLLLVQLHLIEARTQHTLGLGAVLDLRFFVLA